jgi:hypothetical protein
MTCSIKIIKSITMKKTLHAVLTPVLIALILSLTSVTAQPLSGNYTINSALPTLGTNFQSFNDFASSINANGISANVIATVEPGSGPYQESVIFNNVQGTGVGAGVTINGSGETISAVTSSANRHVVRLTDCSFFAITNLHIVYDTASSGGTYGIHIFNSGSDISITNCDIDLSGTTSTLIGSIVASGSETSILEPGVFHRVTISGNTCTGGGYGVSVYGTVGNLASDVVIAENNIYDFHSNGIYLRETNGVLVRDNRFDKRTANIGTTNAIQIAQSANQNASIYNNFISVSQIDNGTMTIRGIYLFGGSGHKVYNNVIHDVRLTRGNFSAIDVRASGSSPKIYFNTVSLDHGNATTGNLYGFREELSNTGTELRNNIFSLGQTSTGLKACIALGTTSTVTSAVNSNYNDLYAPGGSVAVRGTTTPTSYISLTDWSTASNQDLNSVSVDPMFSSVASPVPTNLSLDNLGVSIGGYTVDVTGTLRSVTPDMGAYEFLSVGIDKAGSIESFSVYPNPAISEIRFEMGSAMSDNYKLEIFSAEGRIVRTFEAKGTNSGTPGLLNIETLSPGKYFIRCLDGNIVRQSSFLKQ